MRKEYDLSNARKNPYASMLMKPITIRIDEDSVSYFKTISEEVGIPYQSLINLFLRDCAASIKIGVLIRPRETKNLKSCTTISRCNLRI